ncbi:hypothetical protein ACFPK9_11840 [Rubritalea spongiae]|uniref:Chromosome segregation protein SMC n=1 Tax=Rubritalea spongiae TaxID=430797 RepID=A0ABW5DZ46_9BACT
MEKIFGILTAVVLVLSVWIGFKNSSKLADQKEALTSEEARMKSNEAEQKDVKAKIKAEQEEIVTLENENQKAGEELVALQGEIDELKSQVSDKKTELESIDVKVAAANELREQISDSEDLIEQVESTQNKIAQLKADIESEKANLESVTQSAEQAESVLAEKSKIVEFRSTGKSAPSLSTTVRGVYGSWGFVTLNSGNAQGVTPGSILDVLRNGEVVAKLKVTTVEQNRSAADIIPGESGVNIALRSGDRVVAERSAQ